MKKVMLTMLLGGSLVFCSNSKEVFIPEYTIEYGSDMQMERSITEISEQDHQRFMNGKLHDMILRIDEGYSFNLNFFLCGDVFSMRGDEDAKYRVDTKRSFYMKAPANNTFVFSLDKKTWKSFGEFFRGGLNASLLPGNQDAEHVAKVTCKLNFR